MPNLDIIFYTIWDSFHNTIMLYTFGLEDFFRRKLILTGIILRRSLLDLKYLELILLCLAVSVFCCSDHRLSDSFLHSFVNPDADHDAGPAVQGYLLCLWMCYHGIPDPSHHLSIIYPLCICWASESLNLSQPSIQQQRIKRKHGGILSYENSL